MHSLHVRGAASVRCDWCFPRADVALDLGCAVVQSDGMSVTNAGTSNLGETLELWKLNA